MYTTNTALPTSNLSKEKPHRPLLLDNYSKFLFEPQSDTSYCRRVITTNTSGIHNLITLLRAIYVPNPLPVLATIGSGAVSNIQGDVLFLVAMGCLFLNPIPLMAAAESGMVSTSSSRLNNQRLLFRAIFTPNQSQVLATGGYWKLEVEQYHPSVERMRMRA